MQDKYFVEVEVDLIPIIPREGLEVKWQKAFICSFPIVENWSFQTNPTPCTWNFFWDKRKRDRI